MARRSAACAGLNSCGGRRWSYWGGTQSCLGAPCRKRRALPPRPLLLPLPPSPGPPSSSCSP
eukprot:7598182-Pyramimonas_sp.AAC.1